MVDEGLRRFEANQVTQDLGGFVDGGVVVRELSYLRYLTYLGKLGPGRASYQLYSL